MSGPQKLGPGVIKFGDTGSTKEFQSRTTKTEYAPDLKLEDAVALLDGSKYQPDGEWAGAIKGTFYQDYDMSGLIAWCFTHAGELLPFTFTPLSGASNITFTGQCVIKPVNVGGDPGKTNTTDFEFTVVGKPDMKPASDGVGG